MNNDNDLVARVASLEERLGKLATDKAHLQLVVQLMDRMSAVPGLDNVVDNMLQAVADVIGGVNLILYYRIDEALYYADVFGLRKRVESLEDELVGSAFETREPIERQHPFENTRMLTPEFSSAYTWVVPLIIGAEVIGVLKMEGLHVAMRAVSQQLPTFFSHAALVLNGELHGHTRLKMAYDDLEREMAVRVRAEEDLRLANATLEGRVVERTAELQRVNDALRKSAEQIRSLLEESERARRALERAIEDQKRTEEKLRKVNRALRMLSDSNQALIRGDDEKGLLREICRIVVERGGYRLAWVGFAEHDEVKSIRPAAQAGDDSGYIATAKLSWAEDDPRGQGPGGVAIRTGRPAMARNIPEDPVFAPWQEEANRRGYQSIAALPLVVEGRPFGVLSVYSAEVDSFDAEEVEILQELAGDLAFGIEAARTRTERWRAENKLKEQHSTLRGIIDGTDALIFSVDGQYRYTSFNKGHAAVMQALYGAQIETGRSPLEYMTVKEDREVARSNLDRALAGERLVEEAYSGENLRSRKYFRVSHGPIRMETGEVIGVAVLAQDMTDRRRSEEALRQSEKDYRTLLRKIQAAVVVHGPDTRILSCNPAAQALLGVSEEQALGRSTMDPDWHFSREDGTVMPVEEYPANRVLATRQSFRDLVVGVHRPVQGDNVWVLVSADPEFREDGEIAKVIVTFVDVTRRARAEEALRKSQQRYRDIFDNVLDGLYLLEVLKDGRFRTIEVNAALERLTGVPRTRSIGKTQEEIVPEEVARAVNAKYRRCVEEGRPTEEEVLLELPAGRRVFQSILVPARDEAGVVNRIIGISRDITESKRAEESLRRLNRELEAISKCNETLMRAEDEQELLGEICRIVCDKAGYRMAWVGYAENDAARTVRPVAWDGIEDGYLGESTFTWADEKRGRGPAGVAIRSGEPVWIQDFATDREAAPWRDSALQRGYRSSIALPLRDEDARTFGVLNIYSSEPDAFTRDEVRVLEELSGNLAFGITVLRGRIERRRAENALEESEAKLRSILDNIGIGVTLISPKMEILEVNAQARRWYPAVDTAQAPICYQALVDPPRDVVCDGCPVCETLRDGQAHELVTQRLRAGAVRDYRITSSPVLNASGAVTAAIDMVEDITERLLLESQYRQAQKMEAVGRLAGGVAHDFNNALCVIVGYSDMALKLVARGSPVFDSLREIRLAAERSANLTRQLLAFARKQTVAPKVLELNDTVEGMLKMLRRLIGEDIVLAWKPAAGAWPIKVDPSQIDQILANLCVNARDAITGSGTVTIETKNVAFDETFCVDHAGFVPGEYVMLAVDDNGCGIGRETLARLFEPFFTTQEAGTGTGLGLATVYGIVKQNNGFINVRSVEGNGATFEIYLPRHLGAPGELQECPAVQPALGWETILLVEDDSANLSMVRKMLEALGYQVLAASAPSEAIRLADTCPGEIHLFLSDVVMPELSGPDLAGILGRRYPAIRCLFMSGYTGDVLGRHGVLDEGINFLQKPFSMLALATKVREVLRQDQ